MITEKRSAELRELLCRRKQEGKCTQCGGVRDNPKFYHCSKCLKRTRTYITRLKASRAEKSICVFCGKVPVTNGVKQCKNCSKEVYARYLRHPEYRTRYIERYRKLKDKVFAAYGGYSCRCCGETEPMFLCIDHINGGGNEHRRSIGRDFAGRNFYKWLCINNFPEGYQVLCHNCNFGKHLNNGTCPHKKKIDSLVIK